MTRPSGSAHPPDDRLDGVQQGTVVAPGHPSELANVPQPIEYETPVPAPRVVRTTVLTFLVVLVPAAVIAVLYLRPVADADVPLPVGFDMPKYAWRANLVAESGLQALVGATPESGLHTNPDRIGFPVAAGVLEPVLRLGTFDWLLIYPAVMAVALGLAAGAVAVRGLEEPRWAFAVYALVVAASGQVLRTAAGYADNLMVDVVLMGAAALVIAVAASRASWLAPVLLLAAASVIHWPMALVFGSLVLTLAVWLVPRSYRMVKLGEPLASTPSARLVAGLGAGTAAGFAALWIGPMLAERLPLPTERALERKNQGLGSRYLLPLMVPVAAAGAALFRWGLRDSAGSLPFLVLWSLPGLAALVVVAAAGPHIPAYRLVPFSLGLSLLVAAGLTALGRIAADKLGWAGALIASAVVAGVIVLQAGWASGVWSREEPVFTEAHLSQAATAGRYLEMIGGDRPAIFVAKGPSLALPDHIVRAAMPPGQIRRPLIFVGKATDLLAGRATLKEGNEQFNNNSLRSWSYVAPALEREPIVILLESLAGRRPPRVPATPLGPGAWVLRGPPPPAPVVPPRLVEPVSWPSLLWRTAFAVILLGAVGAGWATATGGRLLDHIGLSPAFGIGAVVLTGLVVDTLGGRLDGRATSWVVLVTAGGIGWLVALAAWRRRRQSETS